MLELRGDDIGKVIHAYGTTGIVTEVEMPLAPAYAWIDMVVGVRGFRRAARFAQALAASDGLLLKLDSLIAWPLPRYFRGTGGRRPARGPHVVMVMVAPAARWA